MAKKKLTVSQILQKSIDEIKDGFWICGELCKLRDEAGEYYAKPMACALGMVSIYGGTAPKHSLRVGYYKSGRKAGTSKFKTFMVASYPSDNPALWVGAPLKALEMLVLAAPKNSLRESPKVMFAYDQLRKEQFLSTRNLSDAVITINDGFIKGDVKAAQWFTRALLMAQKKGL